jgi:hypothetical protein
MCLGRLGLGRSPRVRPSDALGSTLAVYLLAVAHVLTWAVFAFTSTCRPPPLE